MAEYKVTFIQYHTYTVDAKNEDDALDKAYRDFRADMRSSVASTQYDDYEIEGGDDDEEDGDEE